MTTRQHHYVPQFYLRRFKSRCRRINLHNIHRSLTIRDASIKHECSKPNYYRTAQIEDALAEIEGRAAIAISAVRDGGGGCDMDTVRQFIAAQLLRTPAFTSQTEAINSKFQELFGGRTVVIGESTTAIRFDAVEPETLPVYNLMMLDHLSRAMEDLQSIVVETPAGIFITSDNPVFKYNQYLEGPHGRGTTGMGQTGIQIFLPLSPKHVLVMYDKDVYDYVRKQSPTETDVEILNSLQVISASKNLYFNDGSKSAVVQDLASQYAHIRQDDPTTLEEWSSDENSQHSLIHAYDQTPNVGLNLSFLRVKRRAARLSISKRLQKALRPPFRQPVVRRGGPTETFSTRVARY